MNMRNTLQQYRQVESKNMENYTMQTFIFKQKQLY